MNAAWLAAAVLAAVAAASGAAAQAPAQPLPIESIQLRGDRFRGLHYREMTEEQRALLYNVVNSARAVTNTTGNGPFNALLRSPTVGEQSQQLGNAIRFSSGLSGRLRELATLMAGRAWTSTYEWYAHERYARDEGIDAAVIAAIAAHEKPDLAAMPAEDAMVWRVADELLYTRRITDATYREALDVLGERRLLSTVTIAAYYEYVSMLLNVDRYPLPADAPAEAAAAAHALVPLTPGEFRREPVGTVTPRPAILNEDTRKALEALHEALAQEASPPAEARTTATSLVREIWSPSSARALRPPSDATSQDAATARRFANELLGTRFVSDQTFAAARDAFGERGLVNLMVLVGYSNIRCAQQALAGAHCVL
ncbi:MAG TPA: carboxymuconolactone decarboxylase family protein [Gammaproteobacteria bacterium]